MENPVVTEKLALALVPEFKRVLWQLEGMCYLNRYTRVDKKTGEERIIAEVDNDEPIKRILLTLVGQSLEVT